MKKALILLSLIVGVTSCNKTTPAVTFKTAYIDTVKLMEDYEEAKEIKEKYKTKGEVMGRELEVEVKKLKYEMSTFQQQAMAKGQAWAQQKGAELQRREQQLQYDEQEKMQELQQESGKEMQEVVDLVKQEIKDYGKTQGYDYIYGTGDAATVLYAKDSYDITKDVIKMINDKYAAKAKPAKSEEKKEEKK